MSASTTRSRGSRECNAASPVVRLAVVSVLFVLTGCTSDQAWREPGPSAEFRNFLMHWFKDERDEAFGMLDPEDRERLTEPLEALRDQLDSSELPKPEEMLVAGRVDNPYDIKSIEVTPNLDGPPEAGDRVELALSYHDGRSGSATMVWRGEAWFVDLPESEGRPAAGSGSGGSTDGPSSERSP